MSKIDERMVYATAEEMAKAFGDAAATLENTAKAVMDGEKALEAGTLHGGAGDALRDTMSAKLIPALNRLRDKMLELQTDMNKNIERNKALEDRGFQ